MLSQSGSGKQETSPSKTKSGERRQVLDRPNANLA
ncbi:hypothetical protein GQ607_000014 [Colletotrichum asianum]|uniref:Uncharacterized protein n=1 Tax=Colletotrichum asianum TaxID=702518 RepID=A0A8H3WVA3_9PEZI|nr:hypothetical protein GQ607_000014 [Colletotrichum asianum]